MKTQEEFLTLIKKFSPRKNFEIDKFFLADIDTHKKRYYNLVERDNMFIGDSYRESLFYIIAGNNDLYENVDTIYNFKKHSINIVNKGKLNNLEFLTSTSSKLLVLALDLFTAKNSYGKCVTDIFNSLSFEDFELAINALRIKFRKI